LIWKNVKKFRWLVYVILPFLLSTISFGETTVTKYEVERTWGKAVNNNAPASPTQTPDLEAKLREALELLEEPNPDGGSLGKLAREIEELDQKIRADFAATENELRGKNVSATILKRHQDFVAQYQENMEALKEGLKVYDPGFLGMNRLFSLGADSKAKEIKVEDLKKKLRDKWIPKEFNPFKDGRFPKKNADFKPREPQLTPSITPAYDYTLKSQSLSESSISTMSDGSFVTPNFNGADNYGATAEDLQETIEIRLTPEIKELARELDYNPVKIYEYVRNNIDYAPYYGSVKGAQETLWQKSGNDFDQASLLMALLRASGIPCRYVYGVVEIPVEKVKNWIGIEHDQTALNTFPTNGIPAKGVYIGDKAAFLQKEHVWVEALVPVNHYRGSGVDDSGKGWVPMDPSFKQYVETPGMDLLTEVPFDAEAFLQQLQSSATIGDNGASVTNVDQSLVKQRLDEYQQAVENYLKQTNPGANLDDILGSRKIVAENFSILPLSLPYQTISVQDELSALTDSYRQAIKFWVEDPNDFLGEDQCVYTGVIPYIGSKRITLAYVAATQADADLIASYLPKAHEDGTPIQPDELPNSLPAYLIKVKPQLMIDGEIVATGKPVTMGSTQEFFMRYLYPTRVGDPAEIIQNQITAGAMYVVTLNTGKIALEKINQHKTTFEKIQKNLENKIVDQIQPESLSGELLQIIGLMYFYELDTFTKIVEQNTGVRTTRMVSEAITSINLSVGTFFGFPRTVSAGGLGIDIDKDFYSVRPIDGDLQKIKQFFMKNGIIGSYLEGGIFEQIFGGEAVSTIHILNKANQEGIKVYQINSANVADVLPKLQFNTLKKQSLQNLIDSGKEITIPEKAVTISGWNGTGYIVLDPEDGTGAYMIDGGFSGGKAPGVFNFGFTILLTWIGNCIQDYILGDIEINKLLDAVINVVLDGIAMALFSYLVAAAGAGVIGIIVAAYLTVLVYVVLSMIVWEFVRLYYTKNSSVGTYYKYSSRRLSYVC